MTYIYLVRSGGLLSHAAPVAAFSKRDELITWLRARPADSRALLKLYQMNDGGGGAVIELDINEIIKEGQ